jgi:hypothetical protein
LSFCQNIFSIVLRFFKLPRGGKYIKQIKAKAKELGLDSIHMTRTASRVLYKRIAKKCPICSKQFVTLEGHKREKTTCSHGCSNTYFRSGKDNGMFSHGSSNYRNIAFIYHEPKCKRCSYNQVPEILVVHHVDRDRTNNSKDNLEILCPNCHAEEHFNSKDGYWKYSR